jgi:O-antigen/teichoic acid export membrane protein
LTSIQSVLAAFAIILIDLLGCAGLDKVLALAGGPAMVALWAQLQSVVELVSTVALAGVLQGLTVLITQVRESRDERSLLSAALKLGLGTSLAVALGVLLVAGHIRGEIKPDLFLLAASAGCIAVIPATLNAYWLGKHQQQRMLGLALLNSTILVLVAVGAWFGLSLRGLMWVQCLVLTIIGSVVWRYLRKLSRAGDGHTDETQYLRRLVSFVPVGLAIGIMSPVSMLLVRGMLSGSPSWEEVGFLQTLWRSTEWVTATAAGVLSLVFLPRFSSAFVSSNGGSARFKQEMARAGVVVLIPAACLLLLIYLNQRAMLATLYDARFVVSDVTAALFMLGSWIRIASWLFLFGLFAAHRTRLIMAGEVLSLPLYALLLWLFSAGMTLERTALLYLVSYLVYLAFTAASLLYSLRKIYL